MPTRPLLLALAALVACRGAERSDDLARSHTTAPEVASAPAAPVSSLDTVRAFIDSIDRALQLPALNRAPRVKAHAWRRLEASYYGCASPSDDERVAGLVAARDAAGVLAVFRGGRCRLLRRGTRFHVERADDELVTVRAADGRTTYTLLRRLFEAPPEL